MASFASRIAGALRLDPATFDDIECDPSAMPQAAVVVLLAGAATGIAQLPDTRLAGAAIGMALGTIGWTLWAAIVWLVGRRWLAEPRTEAGGAELLRTLGFAAAPGVVRILGVVASVAPVVDVIAGVWTVLAMIVAVRQVLDFSTTWRAVAVCTIGWTTQVLVLLAAATLLLPQAEQPDRAAARGAGSVGSVKATGVAPAVDPARAP